jgi:hypothetical protein
MAVIKSGTIDSIGTPSGCVDCVPFGGKKRVDIPLKPIFLQVGGRRFPFREKVDVHARMDMHDPCK